MIFDDSINNTPPNKQMMPSPKTRKDNCVPITYPCTLSETESEIFTVSRVTASPIRSPQRPNQTNIKKLESVNIIPVRRRVNPTTAPIIDRELDTREEV